MVVVIESRFTYRRSPFETQQLIGDWSRPEIEYAARSHQLASRAAAEYVEWKMWGKIQVIYGQVDT